MLERSLIAAVLVVVSVAGWIIFNQWSVRRIADRSEADPLLSDLPSNVPSIVYFTTPFCEPCRTLQKPALESLKSELGSSVSIIQVDATQDPDAADRWGVFSAPTTFVLDRHHKPLHVNRGVATTEILKRQLGIVA